VYFSTNNLKKNSSLYDFFWPSWMQSWSYSSVFNEYRQH